MKLPQHGSNPHYVYQEMGIDQPDHIIDLSANINPLGPPACIKENWMDLVQKINDYPDPYAYSLKEIIAEKELVEIDSILIGNGGAELIFLIARVLSGKNVLIIEPTFSEYENACKANDCNVYYHYTRAPDWNINIDELKDKLLEMDAVILCNPNNPTGVYYSQELIVKLLEHCKETGTWLIIDEAFYDFVEDYNSMTRFIHEYPNLVILRSMTKMFAIPGIRLGYAIGKQTTISKMHRFQPHWSVNALAMAIGELCLKDKMFVDKTIQYIKKERDRLLVSLGELGFEVSPTSVNFYLLKEPNSESVIPLYSYLLKMGIVPRHTFNFPGLDGKWLRFAIKSTEENQQLLEALKQWKQLP